MLDALTLLAIDIGIDPEIRQIGGLTLTWHGVFTAVGIAAGVFLAVIIGRRKGFTEDDVYSVALVAIPGGIIGARALYVVERWSVFSNDWVDIFRVNEGGISIYGAILGGVAAALIYSWFKKFPIYRALDGAAPAMLLGLAIGRIGDLINGEHFAKLSDLPWAVRYTNLNSPSVTGHPLPECLPSTTDIVAGIGACPQHPAVAYEMIGDLLVVGLLLLMLRFVVRREGVVFFSFMLLYSLLRFGTSELRLDSREIIAGLTTPQVTALFIIPMSVVGLLYCWLRPRGAEAELEPATPPPRAATPARSAGG